MAFLDDLSKKITDVTSTAAQKTRDMTEISKLNSAVNEEEAKINNAYIQIGRLYCANHGDDCEESFSIFVNAVKESEKRIVEMKNQIRDIKGIATCKNCGAEIPNNVAFCCNCGTPAPRPVPVVDPNSVFCPGCGASVPKGMRFCTSCGYRMPEMPQVPVQINPQPGYVPAADNTYAVQNQYVPVNEPSAEAFDIDASDASKLVMEQAAPEVSYQHVSLDDTYSPDRRPVQQSESRFCTNCGKVLAEGMVFCTECGTRVM